MSEATSQECYSTILTLRGRYCSEMTNLAIAQAMASCARACPWTRAKSTEARGNTFAPYGDLGTVYN
jgi:hypothetical protein